MVDGFVLTAGAEGVTYGTDFTYEEITLSSGRFIYGILTLLSSNAVTVANIDPTVATDHVIAVGSTGTSAFANLTLNGVNISGTAFVVASSIGDDSYLTDTSTLTIADAGALVIENGGSYSGTVTVATGGKLVDNNSVVTPTATPSATATPSSGSSSSTTTTDVVTPTSPATGEGGVFAWLVAWFAALVN